MDLAHLPRGLILVTGPTGSGKSTTLAAIIDYINDTRDVHVLTVEDPVEYVHDHKRSVVNQREIGVDSDSFARALRSALREEHPKSVEHNAELAVVDPMYQDDPGVRPALSGPLPQDRWEVFDVMCDKDSATACGEC